MNDGGVINWLIKRQFFKNYCGPWIYFCRMRLFSSSILYVYPVLSTK